MDMQGAVGPETDHSLDVNEYFASIEDAFENELQLAKQQGLVERLVGPFIFCAVLSVIPLFPFTVWLMIHFAHPNWHPIVFGLVVPAHSFYLWWITCVLVSVPTATLVNKLDNRRIARRTSEHLSSSPMRFALCYAAASEIGNFTKNRLPKHLARARDYWKQLRPMLALMLNPHAYRIISRPLEFSHISPFETDDESFADQSDNVVSLGPWLSIPRSFFPQIAMLQKRHPWFKLDPQTAKIVEAFDSLSTKISGRLQDKKDLQAVASVLNELAKFLYSMIPEVSSVEGHEAAEITAFGERSLLRFADDLTSLPPYRAEPRPLERKERVKSGFVIAVNWFANLFCHDNLLIRFFVWWGLAQGLVVAATILANHYVPSLKVDSTLVSFIVGTPLLVAAAALAAAWRKTN
jgi:hypothetical protein